MKWLAVALALGACNGDQFRPIDEIDKVPCNRADPDGHVYGELAWDLSTPSLGVIASAHAMGVPQADRVEMQTGDVVLVVGLYSSEQTSATFGDQVQFATGSQLVQDCGISAGRFEAHFARGDLSGWYTLSVW